MIGFAVCVGWRGDLALTMKMNTAMVKALANSTLLDIATSETTRWPPPLRPGSTT